MYQLSTEDGLPDMHVYRIIQDEDNYYWLATDSGIYKYDGENFQLFKHPDQKGTSTFGVVEDAQGQIWYNNGHGQIFSINDQDVILRHEFDQKPFGFIEDISVVEKNVYINSRNSILSFDTEDYSTNIYMYQSSDFPSTAITATGYGNLVLRDNTVITMNGSVNVVKSKTIDLMEDQGRGFLISESKKIFLSLPVVSKNVFYNLNSGRKVHDNFKELEYTTLNLYKKIGSSHWFLTSTGSYEYVFDGKRFKLVSNYLKEFTLTDVIKDHAGNMLFTTLNSGIFIVPDINLKKITYEAGTKVNSVQSLVSDDKGNLYFITNNNKLHKFDIRNNQITSLEIPRHQNQFSRYDEAYDKLMLFNKTEISFFDKNLSLVKKIKEFPAPKDLIRASETSFLAAFYDRVSIFNTDFKEINSIPERTSHVLKADKDKFFYSSIDGLKYTNPALDLSIPVLFKNSPINSSRIIHGLNNDIWALSVDSLYQVSSSMEVSAHSVAESNKVQRISDITASSENLYLGTNNGIYKFLPSVNIFYNYVSSSINEKRNITEVEVTSDRLWFSDGLNIYALNTDFEKNAVSSTVGLYIKNVTVDGNKVDPNEISISDQENLKIDLWVNRLNSKDQYRYFFKLDTSNDWIELPENSSTISLNGLPSGSRNISLQAEDIYTGEESAIKELTIEVDQPIFLKWWFIAGGLTFLILLIIVFIKVLNYFKQIKWQRKIDDAKREQRLAQLQLENLRSQMNPHFLFNALNSLQDHIISNEKKEASKFLVKFSRLVRMYLEHSQYDRILLSRELEALELYLFLENKRFDQQLNFSIHVAEEVDKSSCKVPSLFIQPYIENALIHGLLHKEGEKVLKISFNLENNFLVCRILDNGIGRKHAEIIDQRKGHNSFSTEANVKRIKLMNSREAAGMSVIYSDLEDEYGRAVGTLVTINLKYES